MPKKMEAPTVGTIQSLRRAGRRVLADVPLFAGLPPRDLRRVAALAEEAWFPAGRLIVEEGKPATGFYVILDGSARVVKGKSGRLLRRLGPGQHFGELALLDGSPRTATVIAETTLDTVRLKRAAFRKLLRTEPDVGWRIMEGLASRIRELERDTVG